MSTDETYHNRTVLWLLINSDGHLIVSDGLLKTFYDTDTHHVVPLFCSVRIFYSCKIKVCQWLECHLVLEKRKSTWKRIHATNIQRKLDMPSSDSGAILKHSEWGQWCENDDISFGFCYLMQFFLICHERTLLKPSLQYSTIIFFNITRTGQDTESLYSNFENI